MLKPYFFFFNCLALKRARVLVGASSPVLKPIRQAEIRRRFHLRPL